MARRRKKKVRTGFKVAVVFICLLLLAGVVIGVMGAANIFNGSTSSSWGSGGGFSAGINDDTRPAPSPEAEPAPETDVAKEPSGSESDITAQQPEEETPEPETTQPETTEPEVLQPEPQEPEQQPQAPEQPESPAPEKPAPVEQDPAADIPVTKESEWNLILVNPWNKLPEGYEVNLTQLKNGHSVDSRAYPDLQEMMDAAREEGLSPMICSSYRTHQKQTTLFKNEVNSYIYQGYSREEATKLAGEWVAVPGTSEHQTGLAVDIVAVSYQVLDEKQEETAEQKWLMENSYKYGWILRYPSEKKALTGINYEPWHYRYVGKEAAKEIFEKGICFEEYIQEKNI